MVKGRREKSNFGFPMLMARAGETDDLTQPSEMFASVMEQIVLQLVFRFRFISQEKLPVCHVRNSSISNGWVLT